MVWSKIHTDAGILSWTAFVSGLLRGGRGKCRGLLEDGRCGWLLEVVSDRGSVVAQAAQGEEGVHFCQIGRRRSKEVRNRRGVCGAGVVWKKWPPNVYLMIRCVDGRKISRGLPRPRYKVS